MHRHGWFGVSIGTLILFCILLGESFKRGDGRERTAITLGLKFPSIEGG